MKHHPDTMKRLLADARNYARADRSDPFAMARAVAHIKSGVNTLSRQDGAGAGQYTADPYQEVRKTPKGDEYHVTAYRNMARP